MTFLNGVKRSNSGLRYFVLHNLLLVISTRLHIVSYLNIILCSILVHIQLANQGCNFGKSVVMVISKPRRQSEQCQSSCLQIETKRQRNTLVNRLTGKTGIHTYLSKYFCSVSRLVSNATSLPEANGVMCERKVRFSSLGTLKYTVSVFRYGR